MALLDRLAVRTISSLAYLFRRPLIALFGGAFLWLALAQLIKHTIDPHPGPRFTVAFNIAGLVVIGSAVLYTGLIAPVVSATAAWRARRRERRLRHSAAGNANQLGSAKLATAVTFRSAAGPVIGRDHDELLRFPGEGHLLTIAPTGAGKGVSAVIPTLLTYPGSILVTDPKGENVAVTARARRQLGHRVHLLDPFGVAGGADAFNPLDALDTSAIDAFDEATLLADMLVVPEGHSSEDAAHWTEEARALLTGLILYVGAHEHGALRTLSRVRQLLTADRPGFAATLRAMQESLLAHGLIAESANQLLQKAEKEQSGVISTAQRHTHFLSSPRMAAVLSQSSLSFTSLKDEPATVYLVLPPQHLDTYRRWLRLMVGCALDAMVRTPGTPADRVLFLFDEFPNLGRMQPIVRHMTLLRGYGANMWLLTQDLSQLRSRYPEDWETLVAAADVIQAFGINDLYTAEYLSRLSGETTVRVTSDQASRGTSRESGALRVSVQERSSFGTAHRGRPLLFPDEIRRLEPSRELLFLKSRDPFVTDRANYLTDPELRGLADANPMHPVPTAVPGSRATLRAGRDSTGSELTV